jgi:hypothetical protein
VFSPIAFQEFDAQKYREFLRTLSDESLINEGKQMRWLSGDGKIVSTMPSAFYEQLKDLQGRVSEATSEVIHVFRGSLTRTDEQQSEEKR